MLIAALIIASFFPPYTQPVVAAQLSPGVVAGQCFAASSDPLPVVVPVACGGGAGSPTLAGTNTWAGANTFTSASGTTFGANFQDNLCKIRIGQGSNGNGNYECMGADSTQDCSAGGITDNADDFIMLNGTFPFPPNMCVGVDNAVLFPGTVGINDLRGEGIELQGSIDAHNGAITAQQFVSATGGHLYLSRAGAPSGACTNGDIWTRSDGAAGSTLYACYALTWHAATTP